MSAVLLLHVGLCKSAASNEVLALSHGAVRCPLRQIEHQSTSNGLLDGACRAVQQRALHKQPLTSKITFWYQTRLHLHVAKTILMAAG